MYDENDNLQEEQLQQRRKRRQELKRKRLIRQRLLYGAALAALILIIILAFRSCRSDDVNSPDATTDISPVVVTDERGSGQVLQTMGPEVDEETIATAPQTTNITLTAVGDIMMYQGQLNDSYNAASNTYDFSSMFKYISKYTLAGDLTVGNLETTMAGESSGNTYQGHPDFNTPESLAVNLADIGFDVLSTANTYSMQHRIPGLVATIRNIREAGIDNVGTYYSKDERDKNSGIVVREVGGLRVGFIAYTKGTNNIMVPSDYEYSVNILYRDYYTNYSDLNEEALKADLEAARDMDLDLIVALMHWGAEYDSVSSEQTRIAELLFENGVDVIFGAHSHFVQKFETRTVIVDGVEKEVFVCYSLGNFTAAQQDRNHTDESIILNVEVAVDQESGAVSIADINYIPVYILDKGAGQNERYTLLDIHQAMADYESGSSSLVDAELYGKLQSALNSIHSSVGAEYDALN